jgi:RNA polymerase sigma-70 factor (ECF subfamily)
MDDQKGMTRPPGSGQTDSASDEDLLVRAGRDEQALEELYRRWGPRLAAIARAAGVPADEVADVLQTVWMEVWRHGSRFDPRRGPAAGWLFQVTRHRVIDVLRRRRDSVPLEEVPELAAPAAASVDDALWIQAGLAGLSERERRLLELAYWGGFSQREVSEMWRVPLGTVKTWSRRALVKLRGVMGEPGRRGSTPSLTEPEEEGVEEP